MASSVSLATLCLACSGIPRPLPRIAPIAQAGTSVYTMTNLEHSMKISTYISPVFMCALLLAATLTGCGPKTVGEDTLKADDGYTNAANEPEAQARYPISGSRTEQRLYYLNQPQLMVERQQKQREYFNRRLGLTEQKTQGTDNSLFPSRYSPFR